MAKLIDMSLEELYARKVTGTTEEVILKKEDFSKHAPQWCKEVCRLKCKNPTTYQKSIEHCDILFIQDIRALPDTRFGKSSQRIEAQNVGIIAQMMRELDPKRKYSYRITDLLKCEVTPADITKGKGPTDITLRKCRPYL